MEFPAWFDKGTVSYFDVMLPRFPDADVIIKCISTPELKGIFECAKEYFPDLPSRGQVELLKSIGASLMPKGVRYCAEGEAERWRKDCLKKVAELQAHLAEQPANFPALNPSAPSERLGEYADRLEGSYYESYAFNKRTQGEAAERAFFVRSLTALMIDLTGQKKQEDVASITAVVFDCNISAREVRRLGTWNYGITRRRQLQSDADWIKTTTRMITAMEE